MIESLLIQNFQAHDKLRIDFDKSITCIVGPSDAGKSAIIRALRWVCTNQPGGDAFVRHGTKGCTVKIIVDGRTVTRRRAAGGEVNEYLLDDQEFKAFGRAVPQPIEQFLNIGPVCWQNQHDAPYWFTNTAGEVSRQLNSIVNLGIIDDTIAGTVKSVMSARNRFEFSKEEHAKAVQQHEAMAWAPRFSEELAVVEAAEAEFEGKRIRTANVAGILATVETLAPAIESARDAATRGQIMVECGELAVKAQGRANLLDRLVREATQQAAAIKKAPPTTKALEEAAAQYNTLASRRTSLANLIEDAQGKEKTLCRLELELKQAEKAVPKVCPTCGQSL